MNTMLSTRKSRDPGITQLVVVVAGPLQLPFDQGIILLRCYLSRSRKVFKYLKACHTKVPKPYLFVHNHIL